MLMSSSMSRDRMFVEAKGNTQQLLTNSKSHSNDSRIASISISTMF